MKNAQGMWRRRDDVAWTGDELRVIAARTSPLDADGPRILEGAAAWVWLELSEPRTEAELAALTGKPALIEQSLASLAAAGLVEPA